MIGFLRLLRASLLATVSDWRQWSAYGAIVFASAVVVGACLTGVESAGRAPAPLGGMVSSWTTPAALMALAAGTTCLSTVSRLTQSQFDRTRRAWVCLGVMPWPGRALIIGEAATVALAATGAGLGIVVAAAALWTPLPLASGSLTLTTGPLVVIGTPSAVAVATAPAIVNAARRFPPRSRRRGTARIVSTILLTSSCLLAVRSMPSAPAGRDGAAGMVPWSLLVVALGALTASRIAPGAADIVLSGLERLLSRAPWNVTRLALRAFAVAVRQNGAGVAIPMIGVAVPGGLAAVFLAGDQALRDAGALAPTEATLNWPAAISLAAAPALLAALTGALVFILSGPTRRETGRNLVAAGATPTLLRATAAAEAFLIWTLGTISAVSVIALAASPLLSATRASAGTWIAVVVNPLTLGCAALSLLALCLGSLFSRRT